MTRRAGLTFGTTLIVLCIFALGAGAALLFMAHGMPAHTDERRAEQLTIQYEQRYNTTSPEQRKPLERKITALRTPKWKLYNTGLALSMISPLLLVAILRFRLWDIRNLRAVDTPQTRLGILILAAVAWLALFPVMVFQLADDYAQDDLTPTMDTGHGAILLLGPQLFPSVLIVLLAFGRFVILRNVLLPANLWNWDRTRPYRSFVWSALYGVLGGLLATLIVLSITNFPWAFPSLSVGLYVVLSTRAALLNSSQ